MRNGWTGGQYSLVRGVFGAYLFVHFVQLAPWAAELFSNRGVLPVGSDSPLVHLFPNVLALWDGPFVVTGLVIAAAGLSLMLAIGAWDRPAALAIWYVWACLHGRMPLIGNPGLPYVGWLLLAHACLPTAPYGSWAARGRADPGGGWQMPAGIFAVAWVLMALGYTYGGLTKLDGPSWLDGTAIARVLENPLARPGILRDAMLSLPADLLKFMTWGALLAELAFTPLALIRRVRPWPWGLMLLMHLSLIGLLDFADLSLSMVMLHLFTFDPAWVPPRPAFAGPDRLFYDGGCGLCHRAVRFVLAEDRSGAAFRFAPLDSEACRAALDDASRNSLPDSFVVLTADGNVMTRSAAVRYVFARLGGVWRVLAVVSGIIPASLSDHAYDVIAGVRHRLFTRPAAKCPVIPPDVRKRFIAI